MFLLFAGTLAFLVVTFFITCLHDWERRTKSASPSLPHNSQKETVGDPEEMNSLEGYAGATGGEEKLILVARVLQDRLTDYLDYYSLSRLCLVSKGTFEATRESMACRGFLKIRRSDRKLEPFTNRASSLIDFRRAMLWKGDFPERDLADFFENPKRSLRTICVLGKLDSAHDMKAQALRAERFAASKKDLPLGAWCGAVPSPPPPRFHDARFILVCRGSFVRFLEKHAPGFFVRVRAIYVPDRMASDGARPGVRQFPSGLTHFRSGLGYSVFERSLPASLRHLSAKPQGWEEDWASRLPRGLMSAKLHSSSPPTEPRGLPESLRVLKLGPAMNPHPAHLPLALTKLCLGTAFDRPLVALAGFPCLRTLVIRGNFDQPLNGLPRGLVVLKIGASTLR